MCEEGREDTPLAFEVKGTGGSGRDDQIYNSVISYSLKCS